MKISSIPKNMDIKGNNPSFKGLAPKNPVFIPDSIGKMGQIASDYIGSPEQKLLLATTALMLQPLIDLKFADDDKKIDAAIKSASKAMAGGFTGVTIRRLFLTLTAHSIWFKKENILNYYFLPFEAEELNKTQPNITSKYMKQYNQTLGTIFAIAFMLVFSNAHVDVPLTSDLQDLLSGVVKENKTWTKSLIDVAAERKEKIHKWINKKKIFIQKIKNEITKTAKSITKGTPFEKKEGSKE